MVQMQVPGQWPDKWITPADSCRISFMGLCEMEQTE